MPKESSATPHPLMPPEVTTVDEGLCALTATAVVGHLRSGDLTPAELVEASIARIEKVDSAVNALPIKCFERALNLARNWRVADHADNPKSLFGLPIAFKDYNHVGVVETTYGSPIFAGDIAPSSDSTVRQFELNDAIPMPNLMCQNGRAAIHSIRCLAPPVTRGIYA